MKITNPYGYKGEYLKGNLHTHTKNSPCGHYDVKRIIELYKSYKMEYDFLAITDHYFLTDLNEFNNDEIIMIQGVEYKRKEHQTLGINIEEYDDDLDDDNNHQELFNKVNNQGGINIICHPHVVSDDYWNLDRLLKLDNYLGIEVFNNNVRMDCKGRAIASDLWDELLSRGKVIFGFANDDMHIFSRIGGAYNMVLSEKKDKNSIINALKRGSFYASFGMTLKDIKLENNRISLKNGDSRVPYIYFKFIGKYGKILKESKGNEAFYDIKGDEGYVRVETYREDGAKAWLQPFIINN